MHLRDNWSNWPIEGPIGLVDSYVKHCVPCCVATLNPSREPLQITPFPSDPWEQVSIDFSELAGHYALIVIEDSRFPDIEIVDSTSAKTVIPWESPIMTPPLMVASSHILLNILAPSTEKCLLCDQKLTEKWNTLWGVWKGSIHHYSREVRYASVTRQLTFYFPLYYGCCSCHSPVWEAN